MTTETYTAGQAAQDTRITAAQAAADKSNANIGDWETDHPGQTISDFAVGITNSFESTDAKTEANAATIGAWTENHPGKTVSEAVSALTSKDAAQDELLNELETAKADKTAIPDVSGFVTKTTYDAGQAVQDGRLDRLEATNKQTVREIRLKMVPLTKGDIYAERRYISPVPLTANNAPGCYTPNYGTGDCLYWYVDDTGVHTLEMKAKSITVLDSHVLSINFDTTNVDSGFSTGFPIGYGLRAQEPSIQLLLNE